MIFWFPKFHSLLKTFESDYHFLFVEKKSICIQIVGMVTQMRTNILMHKLLNSLVLKIQTHFLFPVPPTFTKVPLSQTIPTSQTVRFDCEVESNPPSSIYWVKDGEQIYINGRIKLKTGNTLVVSHSVTSDSGIYQCVASNPAGVNTCAARLQVNVSSKILLVLWNL